ncbi:conserved hypothetical protein [Paecilomyces variotii No. 5]|uniref:DUF3074 domain-containing protein n=1 Tax=Byssochlamys spectabilis (strain No. 5 / NBRC 109023) TaxID=1356009 RepID=V5FIV5_BYSSN|nr:conserved hypothetical protein [Paecilomyces variotii No. 5]
MAALHQALQALAPTSWDDLPGSDSPLRQYMQELFKSSRLIIESVPEPPPAPSDSNNGSSSSSLGSSSSRISNSAARSGTSDPQFLSLQKEWGKPIRVNNPKDNPLDIGVYKLSGKDGKGSWFARRSVHEGLPFSRWKAKMQAEIGETLRMRQEERENGQTPCFSVRGIGGDTRTEYMEVKDADNGAVLGRIEVYCLSAQFPGPTTARDFVTLMITTDKGLEAAGEEHPPRSFMVVSKPCDHPGSPPRDGYVRGQYESVELIREVRSKTSELPSSPSAHKTSNLPLRSKNKSELDVTSRDVPDDMIQETGRKRGKTESAVKEARKSTSTGSSTKGAFDEEDEEEYSNTVEWVMVTRSDPGGNVPRWMVEKSTPKSIVADAAKFVNWLCKDDHISQEPGQGPVQESRKGFSSSAQPSAATGIGSQTKALTSNTNAEAYEGVIGESETSNNQQSGLIASVGGMINSGLEMYAPRAVLNYIPGHSPRPSQSTVEDDTTPEENRDDSSIASDDTFASAESHREDSTVDQNLTAGAPPSEQSSVNATPATPSGGDKLSETLSVASTKKKLTSREKKLAKLDSRKQELEGKLADIRSEVDTLGLPAKGKDTESNTNGHSSISSRVNVDEANMASTGSKPSPETLEAHKRASVLAREEAKILKQLRKVETEEVKVVEKIEAQKRKAQGHSEVKDLRHEVRKLKKEVGNLRGERQKWIELIGKLQMENTRLAAEQDKAISHKTGYGTE